MDLFNDDIQVKSTIKYEKHEINELDKNRILCQIQKTGNTIFRIKNVDILVENLKIPVSALNHLRRETIDKFEKALENRIQRSYEKEIKLDFQIQTARKQQNPKINLFLQKFSSQIDYSKLNYNEIYVPFAELINGVKMRDCIAVLPNIVEENYETLILENRQVLEQAKAVMIAHISQIELLEKLELNKNIVADYSLNITNCFSQKVIKDLGIKRFTISPELDKKAIHLFTNDLEKELVVYGRTCLMTSKYCPIGKNGNCKNACKQGEYVLKDRKDFCFPVVSDCINCHSKIYNSKILSIENVGLAVDFVRIDVLNETQEEIENIICTVNAGQKLSGKIYTNGNLYK